MQDDFRFINSEVSFEYLAVCKLAKSRSANPLQWSSFWGCIKYLVYLTLMTLTTVLCMGLLFCTTGCSSAPQARPDRAHIPEYVDELIIPVMKRTRSQVRDLNKDGKVNCIDYTCMFKMCWDEMYPKRKLDCTIVRNFNPKTGFHHLFIRICDLNNFIYVEPRASNPYRYLMEENWKDGRYNPKYDIQGETYKWLGEVDGYFQG